MRKNSLAILVVFAEGDVIDDYVIYLAEQIKSVVKTLAITINGNPQKSMLEMIDNCCDYIFVRENEGFDCGAYKYTLEQYLGWDKVREYDELILMNDSCYGPIYPLEEVFEQMDVKELDFWGITEQIPIKAGNYSNILLPRHIQTYFVVITKRMLQSKEFVDFWKWVRLSNGYDETVANFELKFTDYFNSRGYVSGAYIDCDAFCKSIDETQAYIFMDSFRLVSEHKCPMLKKKVFTYPHNLVLSSNMGETAYKTLEYVKDKTTYDEDLILRHLIRKCTPSELYVSLHNNFCLSAEEFIGDDVLPEKILVVVMQKEQELNQKCHNYLKALPSFVDVSYMDQDINIQEYKYVCCLNNEECDDELLSLFWGNLLVTPVYICNILELFKKNLRLGVLAPPKPYHAHYFSERYTKNTTFPFGNMFWSRSEIFQQLLENKKCNKRNEIFSSLPDVAKQYGYMCGIVMNEEYASVYASNYHYMLSGLVKNVLVERGIEEFKNITKINLFLIDFCAAHESIYIYGAGEMGRACDYWLKLHGIMTKGFVVSDGRRNSNMDAQMNIYELSEIIKEKNLGIVIAMGKVSAGSVETILKERGMRDFIRYEA